METSQNGGGKDEDRKGSDEMQTESELAANSEETDGPGNVINLRTIEKDFQATMQQLSASGDRQLARFRMEYERMYEALNKSLEGEQKLSERFEKLSDEIEDQKARVDVAVKNADEDQATIATMKKEIDRAWKMVDAAHRKEQNSKDTIKTLKLELSNLSTLLQQGIGSSVGAETSVQDLIEMKEELVKERETLTSDLSRMKAELTKLEQSNTELSGQKDEALTKAAELNQEVQLKQSEAQRELRRKEKVERELNSVRSQLEASEVKLGGEEKDKSALERKVADMEEKLKEEEKWKEDTIRELENMKAKSQKLQQELDAAMLTERQNTADIDQKVAEMKVKEHEQQQLRSEFVKMKKSKDELHRKLGLVEAQKTQSDEDRERLRGQTQTLEMDWDTAKKNTLQDKKMMEELLKEKELHKKGMIKLTSLYQQQVNATHHLEAVRRGELKEAARIRREEEYLATKAKTLTRDRDKYITEASKASEMLVQQIAETKSKELQLVEVEKQVADLEAKLQEQRSLYEVARADRNACRKNLVQSTDEIAELQRKLKLVGEQVQAVREEVLVKETALIKERGALLKAEKETEVTRSRLEGDSM